MQLRYNDVYGEFREEDYIQGQMNGMDTLIYVNDDYYYNQKKKRRVRRTLMPQIRQKRRAQDSSVYKIIQKIYKDISIEEWTDEVYEIGAIQGVPASSYDATMKFGNVRMKWIANWIGTSLHAQIDFLVCTTMPPCSDRGLTANETKSIVLGLSFKESARRKLKDPHWTYLDSCVYNEAWLASHKLTRIDPPCHSQGRDRFSFDLDGKTYTYHKSLDQMVEQSARSQQIPTTKILSITEKKLVKTKLRLRCAHFTALQSGARKCHSMSLAKVGINHAKLARLFKECTPFYSCLMKAQNRTIADVPATVGIPSNFHNQSRHEAIVIRDCFVSCVSATADVFHQQFISSTNQSDPYSNQRDRANAVSVPHKKMYHCQAACSEECTKPKASPYECNINLRDYFWDSTNWIEANDVPSRSTISCTGEDVRSFKENCLKKLDALMWNVEHTYRSNFKQHAGQNDFDYDAVFEKTQQDFCAEIDELTRCTNGESRNSCRNDDDELILDLNAWITNLADAFVVSLLHGTGYDCDII